MVMGPDGTRNQGSLRWRDPAAIYPTDRQLGQLRP
jgi:hypothetical protein